MDDSALRVLQSTANFGFVLLHKPATIRNRSGCLRHCNQKVFRRVGCCPAGPTTQSSGFAPPDHGRLKVPGFCDYWAMHDRAETELRRRRVRFRAKVSAGPFRRPNHGDCLQRQGWKFSRKIRANDAERPSLSAAGFSSPLKALRWRDSGERRGYRATRPML